jgi:hypothetical protein
MVYKTIKRDSRNKLIMARQNSFTWKAENNRHEQVFEDSLTVPNMALSLGELLERHTRGQGIQTFQPQYTTEEEIALGLGIDVSRMDTFEKLEYAAQIRKQLKQYRYEQQLAEEARQAEEAAAQASTTSTESPTVPTEPTA